VGQGVIYNVPHQLQTSNGIKGKMVIPLLNYIYILSGKKNHLDVSVAENYREYYMGEGGGFPQVRAVVSQVNPS